MVRSKHGIEIYANILCGVFTAVSLLPFSYSEMKYFQLRSPQESKAWLSEAIKREIILCAFVNSLESTDIYLQINTLLKSFMLKKHFYK